MQISIFYFAKTSYQKIPAKIINSTLPFIFHETQTKLKHLNVLTIIKYIQKAFHLHTIF